jgi:hypothetical protein
VPTLISAIVAAGEVGSFVCDASAKINPLGAVHFNAPDWINPPGSVSWLAAGTGPHRQGRELAAHSRNPQGLRELSSGAQEPGPWAAIGLGT